MSPRLRRGSSRLKTPKVLSTVYGSRLFTLKALILRLLVPQVQSIAPALAGPLSDDASTENANTVDCSGTEDIGSSAGSKWTLYSDLLKDFRCSFSGAGHLDGTKADNVENNCGFSGASEVACGLVRDGDSEEYLNLLDNSYGAVPDGAPQLGIFDLGQRWSQSEIVDRIIELEFQQRQRPNHVLCAGYRKLRPGASHMNLNAPRGLECVFRNAPAEILKSDAWSTLLSRVGDMLMLYLLSNASIFIPLPSSCFLQVAGPAINGVALAPPKLASSNGKRPSECFQANRKILYRGGCPVSSKVKQKLVAFVGDGTRMRCHRDLQEPELEGAESRLGRGLKRKRVIEETSVAVSVPGLHELGRCKTFDNRNVAGSSRKAGRIAGHFVQCRMVNQNTYARIGRKTTSADPFVISAKDGGIGQTDARECPDHVEHLELVARAGDKLEVLPAVGDPELATQECKGSSSCTAPSMPSKRTRPSSWQRRKARKLQQKNSEQLTRSQCPQTEKLMPQTDVQVDELLLSEDLQPVVTLNTDCQSLQQGNEVGQLFTAGLTGNISNSNCSDGGDHQSKSLVNKANQPAKQTREHPSFVRCSRQASMGLPNQGAISDKMTIDRSNIFYSHSFPHHAGLPAKHILNTAKPNKEGVLQLFGVIFGEMSARPPTITEIHEQNQPVDIKRIRGLLKKLLQNARKCRYALLLDRHCSIPRKPVRTIYDSIPESVTKIKKVSFGSTLLSAGHEYVTKHVLTKKSPFESSKSLPPSLADGIAPIDLPTECPQMDGARLQPYDETPKGDDALGSDSTIPVSTDIEDNDMGDEQVDSGEHKQKVDIGQAKLELAQVHTSSANDRKDRLGESSYCCNHLVAGANVCRNAECKPDLCKSQKGKYEASRLDCLSQEELILNFTTHKQVVAFLWAVTRRIIPVQLLGCKKNWRALCRSLAKFTSLRRHEMFSLKHYYSRLKMRRFIWLQNVDKVGRKHPGMRAGARSIYTAWIYWYFSGFVIPLVRAHFYVTESENHRRDVFYYRKVVWAKIKRSALRDLVETSFKAVSPSSLTSTLHSKILGFSRVRFLPKEKGVRPIVNLGAPSLCTVNAADREEPPSFKQVFGGVGQATFKRNLAVFGKFQGPKHAKKKMHFFFKPVNWVLRDVHTCLKTEQEKHAEDFGCSVFGYNDIYLKIVPFVMQLKSIQGGLPQLYFAVCDVAKAFDTIRQAKLCEIVHQFLQHQQYSVVRYVSAVPTVGSVRFQYLRACTMSGEHQKLTDFVSTLTAKASYAIYVDQAFVATISRERILAMLNDHVNKTILQVGSTFYMQTVGIPQGSVVSSLLCSLFYGHLDTNYLLPGLRMCMDPNGAPEHGQPRGAKGSVNQNHVVNVSADPIFKGADKNCDRGTERNTDKTEFMLLRLIDDSLFISTSKAQVSFFVEKMHEGFPEYGCHANKRKTALSFDMNWGENFAPRNVYQTEDGARFMQWSGLLINCHTLEFQADYTRYCGDHIRSSLTVVVGRNQGFHLMTKLCQFMRPKCHPLFYDLNMNSPSTVRLNAYQAFLLCAMKFHAYKSAMPPVGAHNPGFLLRAITTAIRYMHGLIGQRMHAMSQTCSFEPCFSFPLREMEWLGLQAFRKILSRKQSGHKDLILLISSELNMKKYSHMAFSLALKSAVDSRRSSMFKFIKY